MKTAVNDWIVVLTLITGVLGGVFLTMQTRPTTQVAQKPRIQTIDTPIRWVAVNTDNAEQNTEQSTDTLINNQTDTATQTTAKIEKNTKTKQVNTNQSNLIKQKTAMTNTQTTKAKTQRSPQPTTKNKTTKNGTTNGITKDTQSPTQSALPTNTTPTDKIAQASSVEMPTVQKSSTNEKITNPTANKENNQQSQNTRPADKATDKPADNSTQWRNQFISSVNRSKRYPSNARKTGVEGSVLLSVHVMANGEIHCCDIKQSSGSSLLDNSAIQAAQKAVSQSKNQLHTSKSFAFDFYVDYVLNQ